MMWMRIEIECNSISHKVIDDFSIIYRKDKILEALKTINYCRVDIAALLTSRSQFIPVPSEETSKK